MSVANVAAVNCGQNVGLRLPLGVYRARFGALDPVVLPEYSGSTWRGAFGHGLRQVACVTRRPACPGCAFQSTCTYSYLFDTPRPPSAQKMRRHEQVPHPYVLAASHHRRALRAGEEIALDFTLIGRANDHLTAVIQGLSLAAGDGIGKGGGRFVPVAWEQNTGLDAGCEWIRIDGPDGRIASRPARVLSCPPRPQAVKIRFLTPLRLTSDGRCIGPESITFRAFFGSLLRRISQLSYFHTDTPLETDFRGLMQMADAVRFAGLNVDWHDWQRYSNRQHRHVPMGGIVGEALLEGDALEPFWPYLWLGQWIHTGKGTVMGLGRYAVESASLPHAVSAPVRGNIGEVHIMQPEV